MAKERTTKNDLNSEIVQMRAQWAKQENCRLQWQENWGWLLEERLKELEETKALRQKASDAFPKIIKPELSDRSLRPVSQTTNGMYGWISTDPNCRLEIYRLAAFQVPMRARDAWEFKEYLEKQEKK